VFVLTLGFSRKCVRLIRFHSSARIWAELHEQVFRRLGGTPELWRARHNSVYVKDRIMRRKTRGGPTSGFADRATSS
jgi:hypothetical protein